MRFSSVQAAKSHVEYAASLDLDGTFGLLSNLDEDENTRDRTFGATGYIRVNAEGVLVELELLFVRPARVQTHRLLELTSRRSGLPCIELSGLDQDDSDPVLVMVESPRTALLIFENVAPPAIADVVDCQGLRFYLTDDTVAAIELL